jgi:flagellar hook assembly protein FlgD
VRAVGRYEVTWDGRDDGGVSVASGVYMYELRAPGRVEAKKMVLLK